MTHWKDNKTTVIVVIYDRITHTMDNIAKESSLIQVWSFSTKKYVKAEHKTV